MPFQGEPLEIGFNPEFLRDGLEAVESGRRAAEAHLAPAPGPARGRGRQRVPVPAHADPAERVRRIAVRARHPPLAAQLPLLRGGGGAAGPGLTVITGPNGAGKTNLLEALYFACTGPLVPDGERARGGALRRRRRAARARRGARRRQPPHHGRLRARGGQAPGGRRRAGRPPDRLGGAAARLRLPARPARPRPRRAGPAPRPPRPGDRRAVADPRRDAPRLRRRAGPAQRAAGRDPGRAGRAAARCRRGTRSWRATASRSPPTAPPRSPSWTRPFAAHAEALGLEGGAELALPAALEGRDARRSSPPSWPSAWTPTSSAASPATARTATSWCCARAGRELRDLRLARASSGSGCWRCCWPSARCSPPSAGPRR